MIVICHSSMSHESLGMKAISIKVLSEGMILMCCVCVNRLSAIYNFMIKTDDWKAEFIVHLVANQAIVLNPNCAYIVDMKSGVNIVWNWC